MHCSPNHKLRPARVAIIVSFALLVGVSACVNDVEPPEGEFGDEWPQEVASADGKGDQIYFSETYTDPPATDRSVEADVEDDGYGGSRERSEAEKPEKPVRTEPARRTVWIQCEQSECSVELTLEVKFNIEQLVALQPQLEGGLAVASYSIQARKKEDENAPTPDIKLGFLEVEEVKVVADGVKSTQVKSEPHKIQSGWNKVTVTKIPNPALPRAEFNVYVKY